MAFLNYTTTIAPDKTVVQIQALLAKQGARAIMVEYDDESFPTAIAFRVGTKHGDMSFLLPAHAEGVLNALNEYNIARRYQTQEHAQRVAWRVTKDWIEAQLARVQASQAELAEVFLPYLQDPVDGSTVYDKFRDSGLKMLGHHE